MPTFDLKEPVIYKTDYNVETAGQLDNKIREKYVQDQEKRMLLTEYPTVYVINDPIDKKESQYTVYVGETNDIQRRTLQHLDADPKKRADFFNFKNSKNVSIYVIGHEHFNKSMTRDIENRLMQYLSSVPAVKHLNNPIIMIKTSIMIGLNLILYLTKFGENSVEKISAYFQHYNTKFDYPLLINGL